MGRQRLKPSSIFLSRGSLEPLLFSVLWAGRAGRVPGKSHAPEAGTPLTFYFIPPSHPLNSTIMSIQGIGTDIVAVSRIADLVERYEDRFMNRILTVSEKAYCQARPLPAIHLAGRFAAKEAIAKALYQSGVNEIIPFRHIEILNDPEGRPWVTLQGLPAWKCRVSISHEQDMAIAFAVVDGD